MNNGLLPWLLLAGACLSLLGLGFSGLLLSRAQAQRERHTQRLASIVAPHLRSARVEITAFTPSTETLHRPAAYTVSKIFGFDLQKTALYPTRWWIILIVTLAIAIALRSVTEEVLGNLSYPAVPVTWVAMSRNFFGWIEKRRQGQLLDQFPDALSMIVRTIRVGVPVMEAIRSVARECPSPTAGEFARLCDQVAVGSTLEDAVTDLGRRAGLSEYRFFATALALQTATGGTLSDTLENLADVIRKRAALKSRGHAMTSEARTSAMVLAALPFVTGGMLYLINPPYIMILFTTETGQSLFGTAVVSLILGMLTIRAIIRSALP